MRHSEMNLDETIFHIVCHLWCHNNYALHNKNVCPFATKICLNMCIIWILKNVSVRPYIKKIYYEHMLQNVSHVNFTKNVSLSVCHENIL